MSITERRSFTVGETAELSRTITNEDIVAFAAVSHDTNPVHLDEEYALGSFFKGRVAHGMFGASMISALLGTRLPGPGAVYLKQDMQFRSPMRPGETITVRATVTAWDAEKGRVTMHTEVLGDGGAIKIVGDALLVLSSFIKKPA